MALSYVRRLLAHSCFSEEAVVEVIDPLAAYAKSKGYPVRSRIILVEGTSDADLFLLASELFRKETGANLMEDIAFVPAGEKHNGGVRGVIRELLVLHAVATTVFDSSGRPRYRIAALFDNDSAGRYAVRSTPQFDIRLTEFKEMFLLRPMMPLTNNCDPNAIRSLVENANAPYRSLDWELEDLFPLSFVKAFDAEHVSAVARTAVMGDRTHRDLTPDGKARFHHFVKQNALLSDLEGVLETVRAMRSYVGLATPIPY
jgi:hypothetical protein